ncbi:DUF3265 domain-containing protein [Vibrio vulnificus]|nr:DUF3265 domain-containing protein [Vibrio vulnificus]ELE1962915.1 DUF3265 domain-containing protein [Vibrio vulnificus]ELV8813512.1 DUF3265 domain-containing protein [Vibrio vulnificus]POB67705.1 DUF3265 domain-containing protein [Vibrio vulnificus]HAU8272455.1 DUF3265 domain-containing protein [Vibrio vulnificus]
MTRRSSGIHAAWHFWYAVGFGGESGLRKVGLGGIHPLTQRYVFVELPVYKVDVNEKYRIRRRYQQSI